MKNIIEYILFLGLSFFCRLLGLNLSRKFASVISFLFYYLIPIRKDVVIDNLHQAFPELSSKQIKQLAFRTYKSISITLVEILYLPWTSNEQIKNVVSFKNIYLVEEKEKEGNGLILLSGHYGNWEYCAISAAMQLNKKFSVIVKPQRNHFVDKWINNARTRWTNEVVPLGASIRNIFSVLKNKGIVALVADQRGPEDSIKLKFFGRETSVYTGPAVLSLKMNVPILFAITVRQPNFFYNSELVEISRENLPDNYEEKVKVLSERILRYLEDMIRKYPEQWFWMHKRWKH